MREISPFAGFAEPISCWTHLIAALVFLFLGVSLIRKVAHNRGYCISLGVFSFSCVFLLLMSAVYHLVPREAAARVILQRLDHAAIYMVIAGTITAVHTILFRGFLRWGMISLVWVVASAGIALKTIYFSDFAESLGLILYLAFGWFGLLSACLLYRTYGVRFLLPLLFGGLAYTSGALIDFYRQPLLITGVFGPHEIFHVAVLAGMGFHWWFIHQSIRHVREVG